jgi:hypothetical protein
VTRDLQRRLEFGQHPGVDRRPRIDARRMQSSRGVGIGQAAPVWIRKIVSNTFAMRWPRYFPPYPLPGR